MITVEGLAGATVCICAPARSGAVVTDLERQLGLAGASVLAPVPPGAHLSPLQRAALTALHVRKIEQSDVVVVANVDGYTGMGTAAEIAHAVRLGKPVQFLYDPPTLAVDRDTYAGLVGRTRFLELRPRQYLPQDLATGTLLTVCAPGGGRAAWFRVAEQLRMDDRAQALAAIDPSRVVPGSDADVLAAVLEARYPGTAKDGHDVLELEFVAEPGAIRQAAAAHPRVVLIARDAEGNLALTGCGPGGFALPGGEIEEHEFPSDAATRHARAQLGVSVPFPRLLTLDAAAGGTCTLVFDAGVLGGEGREAPDADAGTPPPFMFAAQREVAGLVDARAASWIRAAIDAAAWPGQVQSRIGAPSPAGPGGSVALLEDGRLPADRLVWEWHEQVPEGVPVTQTGVWAFDADGRVLLQHRVEEGGVDAGRFALPAGRPEDTDRDLLAGAAREAFEESQILIDQARAVLLGFAVAYGDPAFPNGLAQARFAAPVLAYYPIAPDADPKLEGRRQPYRRYLADIRRAAALLDWGPHGQVQARAAEQAAREFGVPVDRPAADGYRDHGDAHLPERAPAWELTL